MRFRTLVASTVALLMVLGLLLANLPSAPPAQAADHRDSNAVDAEPEIDMPDVFAHVDPNFPDRVSLTVNVNPFINANEQASYRLDENALYSIKIDNNGDACEDLVVQIRAFSVGGGAQRFEMRFGEPELQGENKQPCTEPGATGADPFLATRGVVDDPVIDRLISDPIICQGQVYAGGVNGDQSPVVSQPLPEGSPTPAPAPTATPPPGVGGPIITGGNRTPYTGTQPGVQCMVAIRDDSFVTDVSQAVFRIGLNPNPRRNFNRHEQDVFRQIAEGAGGIFGPQRGRPLDPIEPNSGLDGFGGVNASHLSIELPSSMLRGTGNPGRGEAPLVGGSPVVDTFDVDRDGNTSENIANSVPACPGCINVWATAGLPENPNASDNGRKYAQIERMAQQLFNTVWVWAQPPANTVNRFPGVSDADLKDLYNTVGPRDDASNFRYLLPDTLVADEVGENNIFVRDAALAGGGFYDPLFGTPPLPPQLTPPYDVIRTANTDNRLIERLLLPDVLRLDLDRLPPGGPGITQPGAQVGLPEPAINNGDNILGALQLGLQNGRRPADDVTDILLRMARSLADVCYTPAGEVIPNRHCLRLISTAFPATPPGIASDSRITAVLQGTDFIEPLVVEVQDISRSGNDRGLNTTFPFLAEQHPNPGELFATTTGFPRQNDPAIPIEGGEANTMPNMP